LARDPSGFALRMTGKRVGMGSFTAFRMTRKRAGMGSFGLRPQDDGKESWHKILHCVQDDRINGFAF